MLEENDQIVLAPELLSDVSQAWFWTKQWQEGELQASREAAASLGKVYADADAFLDDYEAELL